jgi:hypothetical protein
MGSATRGPSRLLSRIIGRLRRLYNRYVARDMVRRNHRGAVRPLLCRLGAAEPERALMNKISRILETISIVALLILFVCCAQAKRLIPDDNLAYPILITLKSGNGTSISSGSGFYLNTATAIYLVTAKHVLASGFFDPKTNRVDVPDLIVEVLSYPKDLSSPQRNLLRNGLQDVA